MTFFVLATVQRPPDPPRPVPRDQRTLWLESWDGATQIPVAGAEHDGPVQLEVGASGLEVAPTSVTVDSIPGVPGGVAVDTHTLVREPLLPIHISTRTQAEQRAQVQALRDLTDPTRDMTIDGNFRLVCASPSGTRQLGLVYNSGLEGSGTELPWSVKYVVDCAAPQPFAEDREDTPREFTLGTGGGRFLSWDPPTPDPTPPLFQDVHLSWDTIIGDDMPLTIQSEVAPYATVEIVGPTGPGVVIEADTGLYLEVPDGVPALSTLRIVTDPRRKSIRLDDAPAAGMIARGSLLRPLRFGQNLISVTAPGATNDTVLRLSWRGKYRSLW